MNVLNASNAQGSFKPVRLVRKAMGWSIVCLGAVSLIERALAAVA